MKKTLLATTAFALFAITMSSCKCHNCKKTTDVDYHLCEKDFDSQSKYNDAVNYLEAQGYKCSIAN